MDIKGQRRVELALHAIFYPDIISGNETVFKELLAFGLFGDHLYRCGAICGPGGPGSAG